jgi:hypothetical protein
MHFDGRKFTNNGRAKPYSFKNASSKARALLRRYPILTDKGYHVWLRKFENRRANPAEGLDEAAQKFEDFTGHDAT